MVDLITDRTERLDKGSVLVAAERRLEVGEAHRHGTGWLVTFVGVTDRDAADRLRGAVLCAAPIEDPDALWVHELIGADAVTASGEPCGRVVAVRENPAGDVLELDGGALVPVVFVTGWTEESPRRLQIDPPEGLLEL